MSVIIFIVILLVLIIVHEFGHFIVAKLARIRVDEFGVGFPPKAFGIKRGETEYTFNWLPFGGFVKIFGENPNDESTSGPDSARSMTKKPKWIQAAVISAGVFFNILLAWILISIGFMSGLPMPVGSAPAGSVVEKAQLVVTAVSSDTPAAEAGIRPGDVILSLIAGQVSLQEVSPEAVSDFVSSRAGEDIEFLYKRGSEFGTTLVIPEEGILDGRAAIGITMDTIGILTLPPHKALWEGGRTTIMLTGLTAGAFWDLIVGAFSGGTNLSAITGPVGIVGLVGDAADFGFVYLLGFTAFISINLAIINLIPFPALDGGRLLFLIIETIKRSPIKPIVANIANTAGFVILILLMLAVTYNDIARLVS